MIKIKKRDIPYIGLLFFICTSFSNSGYIQLIGLVLFVALSIKGIRFLRFDKQTKYQFLFSAFVILSYVWATKVPALFTSNMGMIVSMLGILYASLFFNSYLVEERDYKVAMNMFFISLLFMIIQLFIKVPLNFVFDYSFWDDYGMNKNSVGMNLAWGILFCFYIIYNKLSKKMFYRILIIVFLILIILSSSRKAILLLIGSVVLYLILSERNIKLFRNICIISLIIIVSFFVLYEIPYFYQLIGGKIENLFTSFFDSDVSQIDDYSISERAFFRTYALKMFNKNFASIFFGNGLNSFQSEMYRIKYSNVAYSHCNYTELLCNYGILGFILYYCYKFRVALRIFSTRNNKSQIFYLIVLVMALILEYGFVSYYSVFNQVILLFVIKNTMHNNKSIYKGNVIYGKKINT
jgi:hypothetical protein